MENRSLISHLILFFISTWPFLSFLEQNKLRVTSLKTVGIYILLFSLSSFTILYILKWTLKLPTHRSSLVVTSSILVFFSFSVIADNLLPYIGLTHGGCLTWLILSLLIITVTFKLSKHIEFTKFFFIFSLVLLVVPTLNLMFFYFSNNTEIRTPLKKEFQDIKLTHKPNVYFIMVDMYARHDMLQDVCKYDNKPFLSILSNLGFFIAKDNYSNYHFTAASLSSTFKMNYHVPNAGLIDSRTEFTPYLVDNHPVVDVFRRNGYKYVYMPCGVLNEHSCSGNEDICIRSGHNFDFIYNLLNWTPLRIFRDKLLSYATFEHLKSIIPLFPNEPKFVFAHFLQVHDYCPNIQCKKSSQVNYGTPENYARSIAAFNQELINFLKELSEKDPQAIIIVQADHGSLVELNLAEAFWKKDITDAQDFRDAFGILSALRIPKNHDYHMEPKVHSGLSPVNTFRMLFLYLSEGNAPPLLDDESYLLLSQDKEHITYIYKRNMNELKKLVKKTSIKSHREKSLKND